MSDRFRGNIRRRRSGPRGESLDVLGRKKEWDKERRARWEGRGESGKDMKREERKLISDAHLKDVGLRREYGKDAPKARSFGIDPTKAKDMNLSGELDMTKRELKEKFPGRWGNLNQGGKVKKSKKVRGAGIAKRGVKKCKYR